MAALHDVFAHLRTEKAEDYRAVMGAFAAAKRRFTMHLRPADVADLARQGDPASAPRLGEDALAVLLAQLCEWGNLRAHPDTGRVTTVEDFHRARYLYQLTPAGEAAERALVVFDETLGHRGALQAVALTDIATHLRVLLALAEEGEPDPARAHLALQGLVGRFTALAENAQAFMASLQRSIDLHDVDPAAFAAYKSRLVDYLERFVGDLQTTGAEIAALVARLDGDPVHALVELAVAREASDIAPGALGATEADDIEAAWQLDLLREAWRERWEGVRAWFLSAPGHPSQAKLLRAQARAAVPALLQVVAALNERRQGRSDRSADFRALALWFAQAPDDAARHRLWHTAFGLSSVRHLSVDAETLDARREAPVPASTRWADAPPVLVSAQLRRTGSYERRGRPSAVRDRSAERRALAERLAAESAQTDAARAQLVSDGPRLLSELPELDPAAFALFLALLGSVLARSRPGGGRVSATTGDGSLAVELEPVGSPAPGATGGPLVAVRTPAGTLRGPDHRLWVRDLRRPAAPGAPR